MRDPVRAVVRDAMCPAWLDDVRPVLLGAKRDAVHPAPNGAYTQPVGLGSPAILQAPFAGPLGNIS